ncbi:MAG: AAA domain-containing protein [Candidatus Glassbacteria bacterium]|nr:AAA domain-containing protein [Candidatus Glassbacteria bacterium]
MQKELNLSQLGDSARASDVQAVEKLQQAREKINSEIGKVIVGQREIIDQLVICLLARGHGLLIGVPGLAKTLLISTLSKLLDLSFNRIQFTPDLMPSDIIGTDILEQESEAGHGREFVFHRGPVFANVVLADEINRTPPKTQAAMLQAMQEHQVTAGGHTYSLDEPFFVLATQNPIEQEGTYPLPEAQLDRFMFSLSIEYPSLDEEVEIVASTTSQETAAVDRVLGRDEIAALQKLVRRVPVSDKVVRYAVELVRATRPADPLAPEFVREWINWGAGPRAGQYAILGAKTLAVLDGRYTPGEEDVRRVILPVLRHRVIANFNAEAEGVGVEDVLNRLLENKG